MKKFLIGLALLIFQFNFLNFASAELRHFSTDKNGYKTYFDTESIRAGQENGHKIILARIVGYRPDNSVILDVTEKFAVIDDELYISVVEGDWVKGGAESLKAFAAILNFVNERASATKNPPGDVCIQSDSTGDWYVQTHRISENLDSKEFVVPLKLVVNGRLGNNRPQLFRYSGGSWYAKYRDSSMDFTPVNSDNIYRKIFDACKPYCKLAQTYPR